jgi:hypothetical protein
MGGIDDVRTRGFLGEQLYVAGVWAPLEPHRPATVGWALATKAFADRGGASPRFASRAGALAAVTAAGVRHAGVLSDAELAALATEVAIAREKPKAALTPVTPGTDAASPLDAAAARAMLTSIGTHFDVGKAGAHAGARCPPQVLRGLFAGRTRRFHHAGSSQA